MAAPKRKHDLDLSIFETIGTECFGSDGIVDISGCDHIIRLVLALNYYEALQRSNDSENKLFFIEFVSTVYGEAQLINDWIHFMKTHSHQIEDIHDALVDPDSGFGGGCKKEVDSCSLLHRNYDGNRSTKHIDGALSGGNQGDEEETGTRLTFLGELFDRIHHFLFHLFDSGMRTRREVADGLTANDNDGDSPEAGHGVVDKVFAAKRAALKERREKMKDHTDRYDETKSNKFSISSSTNDGGGKANNRRKSFLDALYETLLTMKYPLKMVNSLRNLIVDDEYDTDAVVADIGRDGSASNLVGNSKDKRWSNDIMHFVEEMKLTPGSFSTGITWFYWDAYKEKIPNIANAVINPNDYGGYSAKKLFVTPKYANYKEEILQHIPMKEYQTLIEFKVQQYMISDAVKEFRVEEWAPRFFHYGFSEGYTIQQHHLCSLVLYCDFTKYCTRFSATFRKSDRWETIESAKSRNQEYHWQSRYFREAIELFGIPEDFLDNQESGPFFCGVDCVMVIPSFCIRLCGPTSTSKQIEVAMNFAKDSGIILELNNNGHYMAQALPLFDCSWLSNFDHEDERVFCGGFMTIRVEGIRIVETEQNYRMVIHALFVLDCMLSGAIVEKDQDKKLMKLHKRELKMLKVFLMDEPSTWAFDPYIIDTFNFYVKQKKQIKVIWDMFGENEYDDEVSGLIVHSVLNDKCDAEAGMTGVNLPTICIMKAFKFTESYIFNTMNGFDDNDDSFAFDLLQFADIVCEGSWSQIIIEDYEDSWISALWKSDEMQAICDGYAQRGLHIDFDKRVLIGWEDGNDANCDTFVLSRK